MGAAGRGVRREGATHHGAPWARGRAMDGARELSQRLHAHNAYLVVIVKAPPGFWRPWSVAQNHQKPIENHRFWRGRETFKGIDDHHQNVYVHEPTAQILEDAKIQQKTIGF